MGPLIAFSRGVDKLNTAAAQLGQAMYEQQQAQAAEDAPRIVTQ